MRESSVRRAFTLVELLVVLATVALLSALLFTIFGRIREAGWRSTCVSNEKQIYMAFQLYSADNDGLSPRQPYNEWWKDGWVENISHVVSSDQVFHCPSDSVWANRQKYSQGHPEMLPSSYIANRNVLTRVGVGSKLTAFSGLVSFPSSTVLICDGANQASRYSPYIAAYKFDIGEDQHRYGNTLKDPHFAGEAGDAPFPTDFINLFAPNARHNGRANVLFFDGHVKSMQNSTWYFPNTPWLNPARGG